MARNTASGQTIMKMEDTATKRLIAIGLGLLALCAWLGIAAAEDVPEHTSAHQTMERARGGPTYRQTDSMDTHVAITVYDLYCQDCKRVIQEKVRTEETEVPHTWSTTRLDATCQEEGEEIRLCGYCGKEQHIALPRLNHQFVGASQLIGYGVGAVRGSGEYADRTVGRVNTAPTCTENGSGVLVCVLCGSAEQNVSIPALGHDWGPWEDVEVPKDQVCETDAQMVRRCHNCGQEETRVVSPAPGHQWQESGRREPTCTEKGLVESQCAVCRVTKTEEIPALGHTFADVSLLVKHAAGDVYGTGENGGRIVGRVIKPSTCEEGGSGTLVCLRCQDATQTVTIPHGDHRWGEWVEAEVPQEEICLTEVEGTRQCLDCGEEETQVLAPAPGHKWAAISFQEPTCTEGGRAVRQCTVCGREDVIEALPLGHYFMWVDKTTPSPTSSGIREYVCTVCGYVAETQEVAYAQMYYNNTITSFGPMTRDLIGGNVWNRVTPLDLSEDGMFTYPLIASNMYTVGTATVLVDDANVTVTYRLNAKQIKVHSESLVFYPNLESLRTGENSLPAAFDTPFDATEAFGGDQRVILAISLRADYDAQGAGIQEFRPDQQLIETMTSLID